jgi:outer membrane protein assembly factor BamB
VAGLLAVTLTGYLLFDPFKGNDSPAGSDTTGSRLPDPDPLPEGWKPWRTSVFKTETGVTKPLGGGAPGSDAWLSCVMGEGALYCGGNGTLPVRFDGATGRLAWRAGSLPSGMAREAYDSVVLGVHDGVLLVSQAVLNSAGDGQTFTVVALDSTSGKRLWSRTSNQGGSGAAVMGDLLMTAEGSRVTAREPRDGAVRWTATVSAGPTYHCTFHDVDSVPYVGCTDPGTPRRTVFYAVDPADGSTRKVSVPDGDAEYVGAADGDLVFLVRVPKDPRSPQEAAYGEVMLIDADTGAVRKRKLTGSPRGETALVGGVLCFAASSGRMTAHSRETGERLWQTSTTLQQPGTPVADRRGQTVFAASASGRVAALDIATGSLLWESPARAEQVVGAGFATAQVFLDQGALTVLSPDGTVFTLDPGHPDQKPLAE